MEQFPSQTSSHEQAPDPREGVFALALLSDDEIRELSLMTQSRYFWHGGYHVRSEHAAGSLSEAMTQSLEAFGELHPERAINLMLTIATDPETNDSDLYTAIEAGRGAIRVAPSDAIEAFLVIAYGEHPGKVEPDTLDAARQSLAANLGVMSASQRQRLRFYDERFCRDTNGQWGALELN